MRGDDRHDSTRSRLLAMITLGEFSNIGEDLPDGRDPTWNGWFASSGKESKIVVNRRKETETVNGDATRSSADGGKHQVEV